MKTSLSKSYKIRTFSKGLLHGFSQKYVIFLTFRFYAKYPEKKYLVMFSLEKANLYNKIN